MVHAFEHCFFHDCCRSQDEETFQSQLTAVLKRSAALALKVSRKPRMVSVPLLQGPKGSDRIVTEL